MFRDDAPSDNADGQWQKSPSRKLYHLILQLLSRISANLPDGAAPSTNYLPPLSPDAFKKVLAMEFEGWRTSADHNEDKVAIVFYTTPSRMLLHYGTACELRIGGGGVGGVQSTLPQMAGPFNTTPSMSSIEAATFP